MIEVADVDLGDVVVATKELSYCVQPFHFEVLVLDALVRATKVDTSSHLVGALLGHREEGRPEPVLCVRWRTDGANGEIMLKSLGT